MKRVLLLEPYYGGSHRHFLQGLQRCVNAEYVLLELPARKWKMRMQFSAVWFAGQIAQMAPQEQQFDSVLCSTFVDVAALRALLCSLPHWNQQTKILTYFHENQFAYPNQINDLSMRQFTMINYTTALASDSCAFNSHYNLQSFLSGAGQVAKLASDMDIRDSVDSIRAKSVVISPGIDFTELDHLPEVAEKAGPPVIIWNHRWEHDKGPDEFFDALYTLQEKQVQFRLIVLGESYPNMPACFEEARERLKHETIHFGYARSRDDYCRLLQQGDLVVSTARHEFFGIAVLEAVRAGCCPLLPDALSYPELYPKKYLYRPGQLAASLQEVLTSSMELDGKERKLLTERHTWESLTNSYERWLLGEDEWRENEG